MTYCASIVKRFAPVISARYHPDGKFMPIFHIGLKACAPYLKDRCEAGMTDEEYNLIPQPEIDRLFNKWLAKISVMSDQDIERKYYI
jgi:hypothetical protein